ncbi:MAG: hypothetical protein ACFCVF_15730 [Kineosporiaceae bacterium]
MSWWADSAGDPIVWGRALGLSTGDAVHVEVSRMAQRAEELWTEMSAFADQVCGLDVDEDLTARLSTARAELNEAWTILDATALKAGTYGHLGGGS